MTAPLTNDHAAPGAPWPTGLTVAGWLLIAAAAAFGIYVRFRGLGSPVLEEDEYYLIRSIEDVLRTGLPRFDCGGLYTRGLAIQYLSAGLQLLGLTPEVATRGITAVCSLAVIPAAYIVAARCYPQPAAWLAVILLLLSAWEVELARFARMYSPFQALFAWYVVFFLRYVIDGRERALGVMVVLAIAAPLVWEGGVFIGLATLLALVMRERDGILRSRDGWFRLIGVGVLTVLAYVFVTADFRGVNAGAWPPGFDPTMVDRAADPLRVLPLPIGSLARLGPAPLMLAGASLLALLLPGAAWIARSRLPILARTGLGAALAAMAIHQFGAAVLIVALLALIGLLPPTVLGERAARPLLFSAGALALAWVCLGFLGIDTASLRGLESRDLAVALLYPYFAVPNVLDVVARPWAWEAPLAGLLLAIAVATAVVRRLWHGGTVDAEQAILALLVALVAACGLADTPRAETRYVFFLYPLAIIVLAGVMTSWSQRGARRGAVAVALASAATFSLFAATEHFSIERLASTGSANRAIEDGPRAAANWLRANVRPGFDRVVNLVPGVDYYYPAVDRFYANSRHPNFLQWTCARGTVERWGNYRLIHATSDLEEFVASAPGDVFLVLRTFELQWQPALLAQFSPQIAWREGSFLVLRVRDYRSELPFDGVGDL